MGGQVQALIVDDEEDMRVLVRATIEIANRGLLVMGEAASGAEALEFWRSQRPDVVVIDQRMPGLTGMEVCQQILAEAPDQRIVLFSAFLSDDIRREAAALGVRACLAKDDFQRLPETLWGLDAA